MPQPEQWARIRARPFSPLRRGAWYRVVESTPTEVILNVNRRPLSVPKAFVQVLPIRPRMWSVVPRPRGSVRGSERRAPTRSCAAWYLFSID